jgi:release factor glutamine methyltransferase
MQLYLKFDYPLSLDELTKCREVVQRRSQGEPVAYICGQRGFYKHQFLVRPGVLIPRPETELLVEKALHTLPLEESNLRIIEFGVGSGCIGLSLLSERPNARLLALDISTVAVEICRLNAENMGFKDRLICHHQDVDGIDEDFVIREMGNFADLIVANPPYIAPGDSRVEAAVVKYEPSLALFAEENGLAKIRQWAQQAQRFLQPNGTAIFEIGDNQSDEARKLFSQAGLVNIQTGKDLAGLDRWILGQKQSLTQ